MPWLRRRPSFDREQPRGAYAAVGTSPLLVPTAGHQIFARSMSCTQCQQLAVRTLLVPLVLPSQTLQRRSNDARWENFSAISLGCVNEPLPDIEALLAEFPADRRKLGQSLVLQALHLIGGRGSTLDLKMASAALAEMHEAFEMFAPFRDHPKVTIFGSARTAASDPLYRTAREVARMLADTGWMVVTGAGPGLMQAAMEGAGRERSMGVSIRLPFETRANPIIADDPKHVSMKYFFTRKLMLVKESDGFICLPGGFGTLDETFELLTLTQTGKGIPVPIVLLDTPGDPFWESIGDLVQQQLVARGLVSTNDTGLYRITDDCERAANEITSFYRNYDSIRFVGEALVVRIKTAPSDAQLADLNAELRHLVADGRIRRSEPLAPERRDADKLHLARLVMNLNSHAVGELRLLVDAVNRLVD